MTLPADAAQVSPDLCVILTTTETEEEARALARGLLERGLAACVQLSQIDSLYMWEGAVAEDPEIRLIIKSRRSLCDAAVDWIESHHPYDVPQVIALPASGVNAGYLEWLLEVTADGTR